MPAPREFETSSDREFAAIVFALAVFLAPSLIVCLAYFLVESFWP